jgi:hypothetical protein
MDRRDIAAKTAVGEKDLNFGEGGFCFVQRKNFSFELIKSGARRFFLAAQPGDRFESRNLLLGIKFFHQRKKSKMNPKVFCKKTARKNLANAFAVRHFELVTTPDRLISVASDNAVAQRMRDKIPTRID